MKARKGDTVGFRVKIYGIGERAEVVKVHKGIVFVATDLGQMMFSQDEVHVVHQRSSRAS